MDMPILPTAGQMLLSWLVFVLIFAPPIGAWVLRHRLAAATGWQRRFRNVLHFAAAVSAPFALIVAVVAVWGLVAGLPAFFAYVAANW